MGSPVSRAISPKFPAGIRERLENSKTVIGTKPSWMKRKEELLNCSSMIVDQWSMTIFSLMI
jgi:hypothetical protein